MQQMMRKMGIAQQEIDAVQVIIKTPGKTIYIDRPSVSRVNAMGQVTYQIGGEEREEETAVGVQVTDDDIQTVVEQTRCTAEQAKNAIITANGDLAQAIISLSQK